MNAVAGILIVLSTLLPATQEKVVDLKLVREYLDRMQLKYVPHPKNSETLVVPITENRNAERIDLYVEIKGDRTLVLSGYPKLRGKYFNTARAIDREKLLEKLLETNFRSYATFFVDEQGDIGVRFTFTTEDGLGYDSFSITVSEVSRIADEYTKVLDELVKKE